MKRSLFLLGIALTGVVTAFGAEEGARQRYLVATRRPAREARVRLSRPMVVREFASINGFATELTAEEVAELRNSSEVLFIEPDYERHAIGFVGEPTIVEPASEPFGPAAEPAQQTPYGIEMVNAPQIWNQARGATIRIGVIDTGIEYSHPDLVNDYKGGFDFVENDEDPLDENGHGTHVAGTIAAADNEFGVVGVAPDVEIYALRVLDENGSGSTSNIIRAIDWAIANDLHIISLSLGSDRSSILEEQAFQRAADAGILAVAASGNSYDTLQRDGLSFPAGYNSVISVGAVDRTQRVGEFSQRGAGLKVVAPGVAILSSMIAATVTSGDATYPSDMLVGSPRRNIAGEYLYCGFGRTSEFPQSVSGKIALIQRGTPNEVPITFREKAMNAKNAGAIGVIIFNNVAGEFRGTLIPPEPVAPFDFTPVAGISKEAGEALRAKQGATVSINARAFAYAELSGTSMATPHVSGVAALIWSLTPSATAAEVRQALLDGATDLGTPGMDTVHGFGLVNAFNGARRLAPEKFSGPRRTRRVGHD